MSLTSHRTPCIRPPERFARFENVRDRERRKGHRLAGAQVARCKHLVMNLNFPDGA